METNHILYITHLNKIHTNTSIIKIIEHSHLTQNILNNG